MGDLGKRKLYPPKGYCIYCQKNGVPLTDEHVYPKGMGGEYILPESSCTECQKVINEEFEQYVQRVVFGHARASIGLSSKRRRRPFIPADRFSVFPRLQYPTILLIPGESVPPVGFPVQVWGDLKPDEVAPALAEQSASKRQFRIDLFARFIAKIGHSYGIAELGEDAFEPVLPNIILGKSPAFSTYIGCSYDVAAAPPNAHSHITTYQVGRHIDDARFFAVEMRFFSSASAPTYLAVLGPLRPGYPRY